MNEPASRIRAPYPGLRPFDAADAPVFFGREVQVDAMLRCLEDHRFVAVVGSSGSGKSSLVRAGLIPAIGEGFLLGVTDWIIPVIRPGFRPFERLAEALLRQRARFAGRGPEETGAASNTVIERGLTVACLRRSRLGLTEAIRELGFTDSAHALLVVDQFEELFAFRRRSTGMDTSCTRDEAAAFVNLLLGAIGMAERPLWVVLTLRSDFIGDCEAFLGLPEAVSRSQFLVPRLDRTQMEEAITGPGRLTGAEYPPFTFEDGLVNRFINEAGDRPDQLPLMQHALMRTWMFARDRIAGQGTTEFCLTFADYEAAGGIDRALSDHAEMAWQELKDRPQLTRVTRHLFLLLCEVSPDGQITRRRPPVAEVMRVADASLADVEAIVRAFQRDERNFIVTSPPEGFSEETRLDISHEALLRQWGRLSGPDGWLAQERGAAAELRRLVAGAELSRTGEGGLLAARDLARVKEWKERVHPNLNWAQRYVTPDEWAAGTRFVEDSDQEQERLKKAEADRLRRKRDVILATGAALALFAAVAGWLAIRAGQVTKQAQRALTTSFLRTIGVTDTPTVSPEEREALWDLAGLEEANERVRGQYLTETFANEIALRHGSAHGGAGLRAAAGLSLARRSPVEREGLRLGNHLIERVLSEPDPEKREALAVAVKEVVAHPRGKGAAQLAGALVAAIEIRPGDERLTPLIEGLGGMAPQLEPSDAAVFARRLLATINPESYASSFHKLNIARLRVIRQLDAYGAVVVADVPDKPQGVASDSNRMFFLADALFDASRLDREEQSALLAWGARHLLAKSPTTAVQAWVPQLEKLLRLRHGWNPDRSITWVEALVPHLERAQATAFAERLLTAMQSSEGLVQRDLEAVLRMVAPKLDPETKSALFARGAELVLAAMERERSNWWGYALTNLAPHLEGRDAASFADRIVTAMAQPDNSKVLPELGAALGSLTFEQEAPESLALRASGADRLVSALAMELEAAAKANSDDQKALISYRVIALGAALADLAQSLDRTGKSRFLARGANALLTQMKDEEDRERLRSLADAWARVASHLAANDVADVAESLLATVGPESPPPQQQRLRHALAPVIISVVSKLEDQDAAAFLKRLVSAMGHGEFPGEWAPLLIGPNSIAPGLDGEGAVVLAEFLLEKIKVKAAEHYDYFSIKQIERNKLFASLGATLGSLRLKPGQSEIATSLSAAAKALFDVMRRTDIPKEILEIGSALSAVALKMESAPARRLADMLVTAKDEIVFGGQSEERMNAYGTVLGSIVSRLEGQDALDFVTRCVASMGKEFNAYSVNSSSTALAVVAPKLRGNDALPLAEFLVSAMSQTQSTALCRALAAVGPRLGASDTTGFAKHLIEAMSDEDNLGVLPELGAALHDTVAKLDRNEASALLGPAAGILVAALEQVRDLEELTAPASALELMAAPLQPKEATVLAERLVTAMEAQKRSGNLSSLGSQLARTARELDLPVSAALLARGIVRLQSAMEGEPVAPMKVRLEATRMDLIQACTGGLFPAAVRKEATRLAITDVLAISHSVSAPTEEPSKSPEQHPSREPELSPLRDLCQLLDPAGMAEVLKYPLCVGKDEAIVLDVLEEKTGRHFGGDVWNFVAAAPDLGISGLSRRDLEKPLVRPQVKRLLDELRLLAGTGK